MSSREWVPIVPSTLHSQQQPRPEPDFSQNIRDEEMLKEVFKASIPTKPAKSNASLGAAAEATFANTITDDTPTPIPAGTEETVAKQAQARAAKLSRRERILNLARQNARTPLPKLPEKPQVPPEAEETDEERERQGKERTIRERLWRLVGGNY